LLEKAKKTGLYNTTLDAEKSVRDADVVYTDTWVDMEMFLDPTFKEEKEKRIRQMIPYQINSRLMKDSKALIMHDMPIHKGYEISAEMTETPNSVIFEQAENRLHSEKAILLKLLNKI
jgi:ornithine carbamoyltransferase